MKKRLARFASLALSASLLFALAACGGDTSSTPPASGSASGSTSASDGGGSQGGAIADQIVVGRLSDSAYLDPNAESVGGAEVTVTNQIYEGLVTNNEESTQIVPQLATDWTVSDDGLVYTFNLKPGVKFSNGTPVTGEDWVWSFYRARDTETSAYNFIASNIDTVEATDEQVVITLKQPESAFLANLTNFNMVVGSKAHYDAVGEEEYSQNPIGTGPYKLKEWAKEEFILLEANPHYHEEGLPKTKEIKFVVVADDNTRLMQLQSGQIDVAGDMPFAMVDQIRNAAGLNLEVFASTQIRYLLLNTTKAPFDDPAVRQAMYTGLNKQEISDVVAGEFGGPVAALVSETQGKWHNADLKVSDYDPEATKKALEDAGYTLPIPFTISIFNGSAIYEQIAVLMKSQLDQAGFEVTIESLERAAFNDLYSTLGHQATILQWVDDILDPSSVTGWTVDYDMCQAWYTGLNDVELDNLNAEASVEMDEAARVQMYQDIQQKIYDNANVIPLFRNGFAYAYADSIQGLAVSPFNVFQCKNWTKTA